MYITTDLSDCKLTWWICNSINSTGTCNYVLIANKIKEHWVFVWTPTIRTDTRQIQGSRKPVLALAVTLHWKLYKVFHFTLWFCISSLQLKILEFKPSVWRKASYYKLLGISGRLHWLLFNHMVYIFPTNLHDILMICGSPCREIDLYCKCVKWTCLYPMPSNEYKHSMK